MGTRDVASRTAVACLVLGAGVLTVAAPPSSAGTASTVNTAGTVRDLELVLDRHRFLPWVNVIASDATGC